MGCILPSHSASMMELPAWLSFVTWVHFWDEIWNSCFVLNFSYLRYSFWLNEEWELELRNGNFIGMSSRSKWQKKMSSLILKRCVFHNFGYQFMFIFVDFNAFKLLGVLKSGYLIYIIKCIVIFFIKKGCFLLILICFLSPQLF